VGTNVEILVILGDSSKHSCRSLVSIGREAAFRLQGDFDLPFGLRSTSELIVYCWCDATRGAFQHHLQRSYITGNYGGTEE
jgi:hypothetical protein